MKYIAVILAVGCLAAACALPPPVSVPEDLWTEKDEEILWHRAQKEQLVLDNNDWLYRDAEIETYLNEVAARLGAFTDSTDIVFKIKILNDPNLNAFAFPNGVIYVHTGLLARMENEAQLAALLAHEMTHCTLRHSLRALKSKKDPADNMASAGQNRDNVALLRNLAGILGTNGSMAAVTGYSRRFEAEADRGGLDLMAKAGYDPRQALNLFELLQQEIENQGIKEPFFFGTHPSVQQRIENADRWLANEYLGKNSGLINAEIFRSRLDRLVLDNARLDLQFSRFYIARKNVEMYLRRHQEDADAHYLLGEIFRQQGRQRDTRTAIEHYRQAIVLDPSFSAPHKAMGLMHYKEGDRILAKKFFESCLLLSPDAPDKAYIQGYLKRCINNGEES